MDKVCHCPFYRGACACVKDTKGYYSMKREKESGLNDMLHHARERVQGRLFPLVCHFFFALFKYFICFDKYLHSIHCVVNKFCDGQEMI